MHNAVWFTSNRFKPVLPEDSQVNPGRYGAELAFWLCVELAHAGVPTSYPNYEDWGWFIEYVTEAGDEFWLCCGNVDDEVDRWHCYLYAQGKGFLGRKSPQPEAARPLMDALRRVLDGEPSVSNIEWSHS